MRWTTCRFWLSVMLLGLWPVVPARAAVELNVAAAASLREVFPALKAAFEKQHRNIVLTPVYGSSGLFTTQIEQGAPFDVFLAADRKFADLLVANHLAVKSDTRVFARGRLALWVRRGRGLNVKRQGVAALKSPRLGRIVIANPALAPYGRAAMEVLQKKGLGAVCPRRCLLAEDAAKAALILDNGGVDAGFVPLPLLKGGALGKSGDWVAISPKLHSPLPSVAVVVHHLKVDNRPASSFGRTFINWLMGATAQGILKKAGF